MTTPIKSGSVITAEPIEPWQRQANESNQAWDAFVIYRDMPPGTRSLASLAQQLGTSVTNQEAFSRRHNWMARTRAYDQYLDRLRQRELESKYIEMGQRQGEQAATLAAALMIPARALMSQWSKDPAKLAKDLQELDILDSTDVLAKLARAWPQVMKAERLAHGLTTENIGGEIDGAVEHIVRLDSGSDPVAYLRALTELASSGGDTAPANE